MKIDERGYRDMFTELEKYEKRGIDISLDGYHASALQIVTAHMIKEEGTYMRDYVISRDGSIEALRFTDINEHDRAGITPYLPDKSYSCVLYFCEKKKACSVKAV